LSLGENDYRFPFLSVSSQEGALVLKKQIHLMRWDLKRSKQEWKDEKKVLSFGRSESMRNGGSSVEKLIGEKYARGLLFVGGNLSGAIEDAQAHRVNRGFEFERDFFSADVV
jgi:hypothetical protein